MDNTDNRRKVHSPRTQFMKQFIQYTEKNAYKNLKVTEVKKSGSPSKSFNQCKYCKKM